ncbi:hypothetical protein PB2503_02317 [Parvularcula bermudensis HTCC2503]|uniref:HTH arsR-type domain-containing protein n=1 Tax=Parvularcula bermudensis (strain ATCC BAA-594 / HTCC2503 / KCTC 12087) TaxID=314260 RepID=E0TCA8_PARBH|nr:metalloregulator ArsR/SmtB family transcription factor [Parvularcula bermudensis]ADM08541.1 hypothetical protein PB2503_02317 [Parvularcula bermudensis HTCC2503]
MGDAVSSFAHTLSALRAAGEHSRLRLLLLLHKGELTVTELTSLLGQSQPRVSRHLKVLAEAGLVERFQEGTWVFYRLAPGAVDSAIAPIFAPGGVALLDEDQAAFEDIQSRRAALAAAYFAEKAEEWEDLRRRHIPETEIETALLSMAPDEVDVFLDLGTGTGQMLSVFADRCQSGIGVDVSPEMLMIARSRVLASGAGHLQLRRGDFLVDPLPQGVDLVCLHHVLHFLAAPEAAIGVAAKALGARGQILIADFAPHDHEDLREAHAHRRLGFSSAEIAEWGARHRLVLTDDRELAAPLSGGLVTKLWRLEKAPSAARAAAPLPEVKRDNVVR